MHPKRTRVTYRKLKPYRVETPEGSKTVYAFDLTMAKEVILQRYPSADLTTTQAQK